MRIDEFSGAADLDGEITSEETTRFLTMGFDLDVVVFSPREQYTTGTTPAGLAASPVGRNDFTVK